jgi:hypothetical protein
MSLTYQIELKIKERGLKTEEREKRVQKEEVRGCGKIEEKDEHEPSK